MAQLISGTVDTQKSSYRSIGQVNAADDLELELEVKMNGQPIQFVAPQAELLIKKSDNNIIRQTKDILYQDGKFKIKVDEQGVTYPGIVTCQLVTKENGRVSTCLFYFNVGTSLDREVLQSISKVETLEQLDEYVATAFANLDEYEKRIIAGDETIRKLNNDMSEAEKIRDAAELERQETFKTLKENMNEAITNLESSINLSNLNEKERSEVFNALKSNLESIKQDLINLNTNVESEEEKRVQAEIDRVNKTLEIIGKLESTNDKVTIAEAERVTEFNNIKSELTSLKEALTTINNIANSNEEIRKINENGRVAAEQQRVIDFEKIKSDNTNLGTTLTKKVDDKLTEIQKDNTTFKQEINEQYEDIITKNTEFKEQMNTDFGNAKTDYFGEEHLNVVDRLNSDFDNVHQRINDSSYLEYSGSSIKADNSYYGLTKELSLKGRTLQNLWNINDVYKNYSTIEDGYLKAVPNSGYYTPATISLKDINLKTSTNYTIITEVLENTLDGSFNPNLSHSEGAFTSSASIVTSEKTGIFIDVLTTKSTFDDVTIGIRTYILNNNTTGYIKFRMVILEGDYTNVDFPINYFEGITSVGESEISEEGKYKISGKSCGKNLIHSVNQYDNVVKNGLTIKTIGDKICVNGTVTNAIDIDFLALYELIKIKQNTNYNVSVITHSGSTSLKLNGNCRLKDVNNNIIRYTSNSVLTTDNEVFMDRVRITAYTGATFDNFIFSMQVEEGTVATDYEPYQESNFELLLDESLRSLPNGVCDEITEDGEEIRIVGKGILNSQLTWNLDGVSQNGYQRCFSNVIPAIPQSSIVADKLPYKSTPVYNGESVTRSGSGYVELILKGESIDEFKKRLFEIGDITIYYELAEPVVTKHNKNINLKTFEVTTHITSDNYLQPTISCKVPSNVQAVVSSLMLENEELNNTISVMSLENEEKNLENIETNLDQDVRLTMLELGVI